MPKFKTLEEAQKAYDDLEKDNTNVELLDKIDKLEKENNDYKTKEIQWNKDKENYDNKIELAELDYENIRKTNSDLLRKVKAQYLDTPKEKEQENKEDENKSIELDDFINNIKF